MSRGEILEEIGALEETLRRSKELHDEDLQNAIKLRQRITEHNLRILRLAANAFDSPTLTKNFQSEFLKMRATLASHHASWPIASIDRENEEYQKSLQATREANRYFIDWVRRTLAEPPTGLQ